MATCFDINKQVAMTKGNVPGKKDFGKDPGNENKHKKEGQIDVDRDKTYHNDENINEDIKANNPTGVGENEEAHWTEGSDNSEEDEKPKLP